MLVKSVVDQFPTTAEGFATSLASTMLFRISQGFWVLNYPASGLKESHKAVELAHACLKAVASLSLPEREYVNEDEDETNLDQGKGGLFKKKSQRERKKSKRNVRVVPVDSRPFDNLGENVPKTKAEAESLTGELLGDQLRILQVSKPCITLESKH